MPGSGTNLSGGDKYASTIGITVCNEQKKKKKKRKLANFEKFGNFLLCTSTLIFLEIYVQKNQYKENYHKDLFLEEINC